MVKDEMSIVFDFVAECENTYVNYGVNYDISDVFSENVVNLIFDALVLLREDYDIDIEKKFPTLFSSYYFMF